jgi:hypothetical protein
MKTNYKTSMKDNVASGLVLAAIFVFAIASMSASFAAPVSTASPVIQKMDTIVVTAKRIPIYKMDTVVVTATRLHTQVAAVKPATAI